MPVPVWSARVDMKEGFTRQDAIRFGKLHTDAKYPVLIVHEISEKVGKPHIHMLFRLCIGEDAVRQRIKKIFPGIDGTKHEYHIKSIPEENIPNALKYLCKGKDRLTQPDVVYKEKYTEDDIKRYHALYWHMDSGDAAACDPHYRPSRTESTVIETSVSQRVVTERKKTKKFLELVCDKIAEGKPSDYKWKSDVDGRYWHLVLVRMHGANYTKFNAYEIEKELNAIQSHFCPLEAEIDSKMAMARVSDVWFNRIS